MNAITMLFTLGKTTTKQPCACERCKKEPKYWKKDDEHRHSSPLLKGNPFAGRCCTRPVFTLEMVPVGLLNKNTIEKTTTSIAHRHRDVYSTPQEWHGGVHLETKVHCQSGFRTILLECTTAFFFRLKQVFILREPVIFPSRSAIRMFSAAIFESFFLLLMPALPSFFNIG